MEFLKVKGKLKKSIKIWLVLLSGLGLNGCQNQESDAEFGYDFPSYFQKEIDRLQKDSLLIVNKNVTLDKVTEQKTLNGVDFSKELAAFRKLSVKPVNWKKLYHFDSSISVNEVLRADYFSTSDADLEIKQIIITDTIIPGPDPFSLDHPFQLVFLVNNSNFLTQSYRKLVYQPGNGFIIKGNQKTKMLKKTEFTIREWWTQPF